MPDLTIPSPAEAVAASIANADPGAPLVIQRAAEPAEKVVEAEAAKPKTIVDAIDGDGIEDPKPAKTEPIHDEPHEGEKPAQFIKRLKAERADALAQLKQAKEAAGKQASATPEEIAALRKEIAERDDLLESSAFEKSRRFQDEHVKPIAKEAAATKDFIGKLTETKGVYERAMALDGRERLEFLKEHVEDAAGAVYERMARVEELSKDRDAALTDREKISATLASERENGVTAAILRQFDGLREDVNAKLSPFRGENGDVLWNQARSLITGEADQQTILRAAALAVVTPHYINLCKTQQATISKLEARLKDDGADRVTIHGRGAEGGESKGFIRDGRVMPMEEVIKAQLNGKG